MKKFDPRYDLTVYHRSPRAPGETGEHEAIFLTWGEVEEILGRPHAGCPEDDKILVAHLLAAGAPDWVSSAVDGWDDEYGWGVIGPQRPDEDTEPDKDKIAQMLDWEHESSPDWDKSGTVAESWYASLDGENAMTSYHCQIDRFRDEDGGGYAYTITQTVRDEHGRYDDCLAENLTAETWEDAVDRCITVLLARLSDRPHTDCEPDRARCALRSDLAPKSKVKSALGDIPAPFLHDFACRAAEQALIREREAGREPDPRSWAAIEAKRQWLRGKASDAELAAAWAAARDAARAAADAARAAAWAAAADAARAAWGAAEDAALAAVAAARATEDDAWAQQVELLRQLLEGMADESDN